MKIDKFYLMPEDIFLANLRRTPLRGFGNPLVYADAAICISEEVDPEKLVPPQRYVLSPTVRMIEDIANSFEELGVDVFALRSALIFWPEGRSSETETGIPFLPPIVEDSQQRDGKYVDIVGDGMHRVFVARKRRRTINVVHVAFPSHPYYAYAFREGWEKVQEFEDLPDEFQKKDYRNPEEYKVYFRQFNVVFPGVQEARKQSNPEHIKA